MKSIADIPTNYNCHRKLHKIVWGDCKCPSCGEDSLKFADSYEWCKLCRKKFRVKSETIFKNSKLSFQNIWVLIWCWQNNQSIGTAKFLTGLSYLSVRNWYRKLRNALPDHSGDVLEGIVELDESFFGKQKYGKQCCVIGAIERDKTLGKRRVKLEIIADRYRDTIEKFVLDNVKIGSTTFSDSHGSYTELYLYGYKHSACNHNRGYFGPTNLIENLWGVIKRQVRRVYGYLSFSLEDLNGILKEWENRQNNPELFYNVDNYLFYCCSA